MASLRNSPSIHSTLFHNSSSSQLGLQKPCSFTCSRKGVSFRVKSEHTESPLLAMVRARLVVDFNHHENLLASVQAKNSTEDRPGRRQALAVGTILALISMKDPTSVSFAAEVKKGFLPVLDKKDGYELLYPFGWQEVVIEGQDKVFKDVIEPLENVSVNLVPTNQQDIRNLGSPQEVAEALIKKVLAPPSQKTKLLEAKENDVDGKAYYTFEFVAQAPNYIRHALGAICINNGKFYTATTGANEKRWGKMKDKLHLVIDSFKVFNV